MKLLILCVDFILWAQHSFMWKHWWFQQSQTETCKNVVRIKVRCTVSFEEKNNLFTISWPDTKEVFFCFTFFFKVQYNQLHFLQNERGAGFFFILCARRVSSSGEIGRKLAGLFGRQGQAIVKVKLSFMSMTMKKRKLLHSSTEKK